MPLVRVDDDKGKSPDYIKKMSDSIYEALVDWLYAEERSVPDIEQVEPGDLIYDRHFGIKGLARRFRVINIESDARVGAKRSLTGASFDKLATSPGIARDDVFVRLSMTAAWEDWSLGSGVAVSCRRLPGLIQVNSRLSRTGDVMRKSSLPSHRSLRS